MQHGIFGEVWILYLLSIDMTKINFSYASNVEHNFAQRLVIKTIERVTGKRKLEKLYKQYESGKIIRECFGQTYYV